MVSRSTTRPPTHPQPKQVLKDWGTPEKERKLWKLEPSWRQKWVSPSSRICSLYPLSWSFTMLCSCLLSSLHCSSYHSLKKICPRRMQQRISQEQVFHGVVRWFPWKSGETDLNFQVWDKQTCVPSILLVNYIKWRFCFWRALVIFGDCHSLRHGAPNRAWPGVEWGIAGPWVHLRRPGRPWCSTWVFGQRRRASRGALTPDPPPRHTVIPS